VPWSNQTHRQGQLDVAATAFIPVGEILQGQGNVTHLQIATPAQFMGDVCGNVFRPSFGGVEGNDADRVIVLAGKQVLNDGLKVGSLAISLTPSATVFPEIIGY
jgi:hypothetical protein